MTGSSRAPAAVGTLLEQLGSLGVQQGDTLLIHTSFRAVGPVEGGPSGLIAALDRAVGPEGTLVMPSWTDARALFDPDVHPVAPDLGVVAETFRRLPRVLRSSHVHAFAARGPEAGRIVADPLPIPPHAPASPVGRVHDVDGRVLLLGVDHDADTTIHLAEVLAGVPYGIWKWCSTRVEGRTTTIRYLENDHCCARFTLVDGWLRSAGLQAEGLVGHGRARLARSRDIVATVVRRLREEPLTFLHDPSEGCAECDLARAACSRE